MPGGFISEIVGRFVVEVVVHVIGYWAGFLFLFVISFGQLPMAPLMTIHELNRSKRKWYQVDWNIWLYQPMKGKALKAECVLTVGIVIWLVVGFAVYFLCQAAG